MFVLVILILAAGPLTEPQQQQLATARDGGVEWDEAALYPLLENVLPWVRGDESGAKVPDYEALHLAPADHRGELFLVEGVLGGPPQQVRRRLARPGPWETNLQQWGVLFKRDPDEVAVVLLADPMPIDEAPRRGGAAVRLPARFYKIWRFVDRQGQPTDYPVFVGKWVNVSGAKAAPSAPPGGGLTYWLVSAMLIAFAGWVALRWLARPSTSRRSPVPREDGAAEDSLPDNPADALAALDQDRHGDRS